MNSVLSRNDLVIERTPVVTVIPAAFHLSQKYGSNQAIRKRVAAYARVSTDLAEQLTSYEAQVDYYTKHIKSNPDWDFVEVYTDEGISATNTKKRDGFNRMIADALVGKIDLILTKSVSRFARNTVDSLTAIRKLKEKGVEVYFEKEGIYTLDAKGELLVTIMSSLSQEESRSISENVRWGQHKRMQDGKVSMAYKRFLGYIKGPDGKPQIVENEAEVIRHIYSQYLGGRTFREIAANLTAEGVSTPAGKTGWSVSTVRSILRNEKYAGNAVLQKSYTVDFLTKKTKVNEGELPQYYVENSHSAIVSASTFELVQDEIRRRERFGKQISGSGLFTSKIICGECGNLYGPKVWHSNSKYRQIVWRCNRKYQGNICHTPHVSEEIIKSAFLRAWAALWTNKSRYVAAYEAELTQLPDTAFDLQTAALTAECAEAAALMEDCIAANAASATNQTDYQRRYNELVARYDLAKVQLDILKKDKMESTARREKIRRFLDILDQMTSVPTEFDEQLWRDTIEAMTVHTLDNITVRFYCGTEIRVGA